MENARRQMRDFNHRADETGGGVKTHQPKTSRLEKRGGAKQPTKLYPPRKEKRKKKGNGKANKKTRGQSRKTDQ